MIGTEVSEGVDPEPQDEVWSVLESVEIDPVVCSFLADHMVAGAALLPTVLQLDLVVAAARARLGSVVGRRLSRIHVDAPVRFDDGAPRNLAVVGRERPASGAWDLALRGLDGTSHLRASVSDTAVPRPKVTPVASALFSAGVLADLPGTADLVYPPLFHGPAFRVIDRFGRVGDALVATLSADVRRWEVPGHGGALRAELIELMLQSCGVWELAETGEMRRPSDIDELFLGAPTVGSPAASSTDVVVCVAPRRGGDPQARVFDGVALDPAGRILLELHGYRPVVLDLPAAAAASASEASLWIAERLGPTHAANARSPD